MESVLLRSDQIYVITLMNYKAFLYTTLEASLITFSFILPASAITINLEGVDYEVVTIEGTFEELETQLTSTPWWYDDAIPTSGIINTNDAIRQIGDEFDYIYNQNYLISGSGISPLFAAKPALTGNSIDPRFVNVLFKMEAHINTNGFSLSRAEKDKVYTWVTISTATVPEPLTILGAGTAIAFGAGFKRKLAKAKKK